MYKSLFVKNRKRNEVVKMKKAYEKKFVHFVDNEVIVWLSDSYHNNTAIGIKVSVDPLSLNRICIDDQEPIDVCSDEGQKRVETIFAQYGMGFNESMEMVLNAICTYTKWLNKTLLKGVPMA